MMAVFIGHGMIRLPRPRTVFVGTLVLAKRDI